MGDFCTGCHHAKNHDITGDGDGGMGGGGMCNGPPCHDSGSPERVKNNVYTEPRASESSRWVYRSFP